MHILSTTGLPEETIGHAAASADEESSLLSSDSGPGDLAGDMESLKPSGLHHSLHADITGLKLLPTVDFWILFMMLGLLTGIGLMTINNIGNDVGSQSNLRVDRNTNKSSLMLYGVSTTALSLETSSLVGNSSTSQ